MSVFQHHLLLLNIFPFLLLLLVVVLIPLVYRTQAAEWWMSYTLTAQPRRALAARFAPLPMDPIDCMCNIRRMSI
ncbi:hypothetical protein Y032_0089g2325 [Ancylostoma ceylanicum]|uniref:Uncharacterized protein n=1 Tax=Ancylostoma ceylanicum TaxID=53326 RepID=A0A016TMR0_9BILA|nr:hypothetical protein Y032_0089g2325 [Ancylostoma ceylanicum]